MKRLCSAILAGILVCSAFTGCTSGQEAKNAPIKTGEAAGPDAKVYPLKNNPTLRVWAGSVVTRYVKTNAESLWAPELGKRTGVKIEWLHAMSSDQFNLMLASGDLPDIIVSDWIYNFPGGPAKAISDSLIIPLNEVMDKYAPNLKKFAKENPEIDKRMKTDDGKYSVFPAIRKDFDIRTYFGPILRKDWLDDLSLPVPETMDEWYTMLKAFKEKKNSPAPLSFEKGLPPRNTGLIGAYGLYYGMFMDNGKIKFGPAEPAYKDFLATMSKWYKEGLIDPDVATVDTKVLDSKVTSEKTGAAFSLLGGGIGTWLSAVEKKNPKFDLVGAPYPVAKKGDKPKISSVSGVFGPFQSAISSQCKNVEAAARWLDYAYGEEGHMFYNFGVEGQNYTMVNGTPKFTDEIMNAPEGTRNILGKYVHMNGSMIQDPRAFAQYSVSRPQQEQAIKTWKSDADKYLLPEIALTPAESDQVSTIMNDINSYVNEMYFKYLFGQEPIDKFDSYVAQVKKLGLDKAIQLYQNALDRYQKR